MVVTKRINTRFMKVVGDTIANPDPGTVVDTDITKQGRYVHAHI